MATHDYVIANGTGAAVRSDLNGALAAIVSNNSSATEPGTMYAYQWWPDTTTGLLKIRNAANNAWVTVGTLASTNLGLLSLAGGTMTGVLAVTAGTAALPGIAVSGWDLNTGIYSPGADQLAISTGGTVKATVDSSGRLLVGTSTSLDQNAQLQTAGAGYYGYNHFQFSNDAFAPTISVKKSRSASVGGNTIVQDGDRLGTFSFFGADGSTFLQGADITALVDGTPGANDMPGRLVFSVTADGAASPTERMRITNDGAVLINTTTKVDVSSGSTDGATFYGNTTGSVNRLDLSRANSQPLNLRRRSDNGIITSFFRDTTQVGDISVTTTTTAYNTSSDYRLKENVAAVTGGITRLMQLKPSRFNFIADPAKTVDGFIAHEAQAVIPEAVTGEKDAVDDDGNPVYQGIDQSKLVPLLTAALQEAIAKIETLEQRLTAAGIE